MNLDEYAALDAVALATLIRRGELDAREAGELALAAVESVNGQLNAVIETFPDRLEALPRGGGISGELGGVPMLTKDIHAQAGRRLEMGSLLASGLRAPVDAHLVSRLRGAGLVSLGRTTTPEFALATVTASRIAGTTFNPWSLERTPGGSSGGSAAAVAAGVVPIATGSDAGGSIRSPAAHCGLVGLKPTRGRVSPGPELAEPFGAMNVDFVLTRSVRDAAAALDAVHGMMPGDTYGIQMPLRPFSAELHAPRGPLRIAYATTAWSGERCSADGRDAVEAALRVLEGSGHHVEEALPPVDAGALGEAILTLSCANLVFAVNALERATGRRADESTLQSTPLAYYRRGLLLTPAELTAALATFTLVCGSVARFFERHELLVTPTCMTVAPLIGALPCDPPDPVDLAVWNEQMNAIDAFLGVFNVSGNPAISLPLGVSAKGLPVGVQLVAPFAGEAALIQMGSLFEAALPWSGRRPPVYAGHGAARRPTP